MISILRNIFKFINFNSHSGLSDPVVSREEKLWFHVSLTPLNQTDQTFPLNLFNLFFYLHAFIIQGTCTANSNLIHHSLLIFFCSNACCTLHFPSCAKEELPSECGRCLSPHSYFNNLLLSVAQLTFPQEKKKKHTKEEKNIFPGCFSCCIFHTNIIVKHTRNKLSVRSYTAITA